MMFEKFKKEIIVKASFVGFHNWPAAPDNVAFLRLVHRHVFHIKVGLHVDMSNRELEFFTEQDALKIVGGKLFEGVSNKSCEMFAEDVLHYMPHASWCEVWEDDENGARVERIQK